MVLGGCNDEEVGLFYFIEIDGVLIESDLNVSFLYLIVFLVFFDELLQVGARIAQFLLADVENDLPNSTTYHFLSTHHLLSNLCLNINLYQRSRSIKHQSLPIRILITAYSNDFYIRSISLVLSHIPHLTILCRGCD